MVARQELETLLRRKEDVSVFGIKEEKPSFQKTSQKLSHVSTRPHLPTEAVRLWQMGTKANLPIHLFRSKDVLWILLPDFFMPRK